MKKLSNKILRQVGYKLNLPTNIEGIHSLPSQVSYAKSGF